MGLRIKKQLAFQSSIQDGFRQVLNAWSAAINLGSSRSRLSLRGKTLPRES